MSNITGIVRNFKSDPAALGTVRSIYNEISSVASAATVTINTYTVPALTSSILQKIELGGQNIATYEVYVNAVKIDKKRTYFGSNLSVELNFSNASPGLTLNAGDVLNVQVTNFRPSSADFESRIQVIEIS